MKIGFPKAANMIGKATLSERVLNRSRGIEAKECNPFVPCSELKNPGDNPRSMALGIECGGVDIPKGGGLLKARPVRWVDRDERCAHCVL